MIEIPDFSKTFDFENQFYLTCDPQRIGKLIAHYELYKMASAIEGDIFECGVFKGASLIRFAMFRNIFGDKSRRKLFGFDTFGKFPETNFVPDISMRKDFIQSSGSESIGAEQLHDILKFKNCDDDVNLIEGNITETIPEFVKSYPEIKIALINLDVDVYEPSVTILEHLYPRLQKGGILILDDYGVFPGETKAVDDYFRDKVVHIKKFPFTSTPSFLIKE